MTKNQIIELYRLQVLGQSLTDDQSFKADERVIELMITAALNEVYFKIFKKDPSNFDRYCKLYKNVEIKYDSDIDQYYSDLPAKVIQYPILGDGVWSIGTMQGSTVEFVPISQDDAEGMTGSESFLIDDVVKYAVVGNQVYYFGIDPVNPITAVKMFLVVEFTEWGATENVPMPSGQDFDIMQLVLQGYRAKDKDKANNQNSIA